MDITTLIGIVIAVFSLLATMYFKGVPYSAFANPAALMIIFGGTVGVVLNAFPMKDIKNLGALFGLLFTDKKTITNAETINVLMEYAQLARKEGMLTLETKIESAPIPFLKRGLSLLVSGMTNDYIAEILGEENAEMEKRHAANAAIFSQAGTYAPTLGVMGAALGLIASLANMEDMEKVSHAISAAFMATIFGIFTGYVLWHPFSNKLKRKSKFEVLNNEIIIEGILCLASGDSPMVLEEKVLSYLPKVEREHYLAQRHK